MSDCVLLPGQLPNDDGFVAQLLAMEESTTFEAKRVVGDKLTRALETIVAFANTEGGFLVLGLEDAGSGKMWPYFPEPAIQIRLFADHIEIESPGVFPGSITAANIARIGSFNRNPLLVSNLREFPDPPNLDAGEGVPMMFRTMDAAGLYPPLYLTRATTGRDNVLVVLLNENRPTVWDQISEYIDKNGSIANANVRQILRTDNALKASKLLRSWVERGLLVVANPQAAKQHRRYRRAEGEIIEPLFSRAVGNDAAQRI